MSNIEETENYYYNQYKIDRFLDIGLDLKEYCKNYAPWLMKYSDLNDLVDIFEKFIYIKNPYILIEEEESESETESLSDSSS